MMPFRKIQRNMANTREEIKLVIKNFNPIYAKISPFPPKIISILTSLQK